MSYIDRILKEWSYRVDEGMPNSKNEAHLWSLRSMLLEWGWNIPAVNHLVYILREGTKHGEYLKSLPEQPWGKKTTANPTGSVKVSTALSWRNYKGKGEYQRPGYKISW